MRPDSVVAATVRPAVFVALWALLAGCRTSDPGAAGTPRPDGGFGGVPPPTVVTDFDAPPADASDLAPGRVGVIPAVGANLDASAPPPRWDAAPDAADAGAPGCNLLKQDCVPSGGARQGCYLGPTGTPICLLAGDFGESSVCEEQAQCAPGLICVEVNGGGITGTCQRVCDPAALAGCGVGTCQRLAWVTFGYCTP